MTKKYLIQLAQSLANTRPADHWDPNKKVQWEQDVQAIVSVLKVTNSNFNSDKFLDACRTWPAKYN